MRHVSTRASNVENARAWADPFERQRMRTGEVKLRNIRLRIRRGAIELAVVKQSGALEARLDRRPDNIERVFRPVHITDLIAVVSRDRQLPDGETGYDQLNDDLRVEMKILGVAVEWNRRQCSCRVNPISGVKLA